MLEFFRTRRGQTSLFLLAACLLVLLPLSIVSYPFSQNRKINLETATFEDVESLGLDAEDARLVVKSLIRARVSERKGVETIGTLIEEQRFEDAKAEARAQAEAQIAAEAEAKEAAIRDELLDVTLLAVRSTKLYPRDFRIRRLETLWVVNSVLQNNDAKQRTIRGVRGTLRITHIMGDHLMDLNLTNAFPEGIAPGAQRDWQPAMQVSDYSDAHSRLVGEEFANLRFEWLPEAVLFSDGTSIGSLE